MTCRSAFSGLTFAALAGVLAISGCGQSAAPNTVSTTGGNPNTQGGSGPQATGGKVAGTGGQVGAAGGTIVPAGTGGGVGSGGTSAATGGASGGSSTNGGTVAAGGTLATGGTPATGGTSVTGGTPATGGIVASGGSLATGGAPATGGVASTGGTSVGGDAGIRDSGVGDASKGGADGGGTGGAGDTGTAGAGGGGTAPITLWLSGDSTMATGSGTCPVGWGAKFQAYFNSNAKVTNSAVGGTTIRSWLYDVTATMGADGDCTLSSTAPQAHWTTMVNGMKAGDYLFVQFGINDTTSAVCPKHVSTDTFEQLLGMMAQAAKDKGANPVFLTSVSSISCNGTTAQGTRGVFAAATKAAGTTYNVPVIDLEQLSVAFYTASGFCPMGADTTATFTANTPVGNFFCNDHTHFEAAGATQIAGLVAKAIKDQGFPLASYLLP